MADKSNASNQTITPVRINRLTGRMLRIQNKSRRREILVVYDLHMDLETIQSFAKKLARYGSVTVADLPGFGGMTSFYKIKRQPTIDNYCAYLASLIKLRFKSRRLTIVGIGVGGSFIVRALQQYPDIASKTNNVLLIGSLVEKTDRKISSTKRMAINLGYRFLMLRPISLLGSTFVMRGPFLRVALGLANLQAPPLASDEVAEQDRLWRGDDLRSHLMIQKEILGQTIALGRLHMPAYALAINAPKDFDYVSWSEHLKIIFTDITVAHSRRKIEIQANDLFEQLPPDAKKFLR